MTKPFWWAWEPDAVPFPTAPTRDQIIAVNVHFQGLTWRGIPMFGPFCYSLNPSERAEWRDVEKAAGDTHCIRDLSYNYHDGPYIYPLPGADYTSDLETFKALLAEDIWKGLWPCVYLAGDGQVYQPDGGTHGYPWLINNIDRIFDTLSDPRVGGFDATDYCLFTPGFELITYGGWSPDNFETAILKLRTRAKYVFSHIGTYTWWGDGAGKSGGPIADWSGPTGLAIDVCMDEGDAPFIDAHGNPLNNVASDGWEQRAVAHCPNPTMSIIAPKNRIAREWVVPTPRGRRTAVALELDAFRWVRGGVRVDELERERAWLRRLGFEYVG